MPAAARSVGECPPALKIDKADAGAVGHRPRPARIDAPGRRVEIPLVGVARIIERRNRRRDRPSFDICLLDEVVGPQPARQLGGSLPIGYFDDYVPIERRLSDGAQSRLVEVRSDLRTRRNPAKFVLIARPLIA